VLCCAVGLNTMPRMLCCAVLCCGAEHHAKDAVLCCAQHKICIQHCVAALCWLVDTKLSGGTPLQIQWDTVWQLLTSVLQMTSTCARHSFTADVWPQTIAMHIASVTSVKPDSPAAALATTVDCRKLAGTAFMQSLAPMASRTEATVHPLAHARHLQC
jgi:hypothetical protein